MYMIIEILSQQIKILKKAIHLEEKKRHNILHARGNELIESVKDSEKMIFILESLEDKIIKASYKFIGLDNSADIPTLSTVIEYSIKNHPKQVSRLKKLSEELKHYIHQLRNIVKDNQELIQTQRLRITNILEDLQADELSQETKLYKPEKKHLSEVKTTKLESRLLNANA